MPYDYQAERPKLFTEDGQVLLLKIRDHAQKILKASGAVSMEAIMSAATGNSWIRMACVDRMVELGELREVRQTETVAAQHRIFVLPHGGA